MSDAKKQVVEQPGVGCMDSSHLDPAKNRHTDGHCVQCCDAVRDFGRGSTVADTLAEEHIRYMNTIPQQGT